MKEQQNKFKKATDLLQPISEIGQAKFNGGNREADTQKSCHPGDGLWFYNHNETMVDSAG
ncbi:MAG: hypothetical protein F6J95_019990 [Leptolyngbya sp. SIO1E4]|nr:hypothetical protein [Leptolyngbya sp. SIO1E4]